MVSRRPVWIATLIIGLSALNSICRADVGVGAVPIEGAEMLIDGSREMLDEKWTYWQGPGFKSSLPIKWKIVDDPVDGGPHHPQVHHYTLHKLDTDFGTSY